MDEIVFLVTQACCDELIVMHILCDPVQYDIAYNITVAKVNQKS